MSGRKLGLGIVAGLVCFALGVASARFFGASAPPLRASADGGDPTIVFDAAAIQLLPDAELRLQLPPGFDAP